ncbi:MAG: hypothetical protein BYD32DRAFT_33170 [Podila humilis]|nr:MAG: hypothetical protein BYD32DRAFT_33170 [Podila humilis]
MGYHHGSNANMPYTEEPVSYETPASDGQHNHYDYAYGNFDPAETFDDPTSREAQAHLAYANQLREQQLYHQNMAEVLQKQQQHKMMKSRDSFSNILPVPNSNEQPPSSGSTVNFPMPVQHSSTMPLPSSSTVSVPKHVNVSSRVDHGATGMVTPGDSVTPGGTPRPLGSPQEYRNSPQMYTGDMSSVYSDDRYKNELLAEVRREKEKQQGGVSPDLRSDYYDYKVSVAGSEYGGPSSTSAQASTPSGYVPPPPSGRSKTMWS